MGQVKFYKDGNVWLYNEGIVSSVDKTVPPGNYRKSVIGTTLSIRGKDSTFSLFSPDYKEVTDIQKSSTPDDNYASISEFNTATDSFFSGQSTSLTDAGGKVIDVHNPLPSDGDSVYCKDLDLDNSDIGTFSGVTPDLCSFFNDYEVEIIDIDSNNPSTFILRFKRPVTSNKIGIGSITGNFSNVKIQLKDLAGTVRGMVDDSANDTKYTSNVYAFTTNVFIEVLVEFHTIDDIKISGMFIPKSESINISSIDGYISETNSTKIALGIGATFTGTLVDTLNYGMSIISLKSDQDSAIDGLDIQFSPDGTNWDHSDVFSIPANTGKTFTIQTVARFMRILYTNGSVAQNFFRMQTVIKPVYVKPSSHRIADNLSGQDDAELVKSILSGEDQNGIFQNVKTSEVGNLRVADFLVEVGRGNIPGYSFNRKFGQIDSVQASTSADIWEFGITSGAEKYTFSSTDDIDTISSSDVDDTQDIIVDGLDVNGDEIIQTATLNGQNKVTLTTPLWRFNRAYNDNAIDFEGSIYIYVDGTITTGVPNDVTTVRGFILAGKGQTNQSIFTVPNATTALLFGEEISLTKAGGATVVAADFEEKMREFGKVFRNKEFFTLISSGTSSKNYNFPVPLNIIGKTDILPSVDVSANGVGASWAYTMLLIDD